MPVNILKQEQETTEKLCEENRKLDQLYKNLVSALKQAENKGLEFVVSEGKILCVERIGEGLHTGDYIFRIGYYYDVRNQQRLYPAVSEERARMNSQRIIVAHNKLEFRNAVRTLYEGIPYHINHGMDYGWFSEEKLYDKLQDHKKG